MVLHERSRPRSVLDWKLLWFYIYSHWIYYCQNSWIFSCVYFHMCVFDADKEDEHSKWKAQRQGRGKKERQILWVRVRAENVWLPCLSTPYTYRTAYGWQRTRYSHQTDETLGDVNVTVGARSCWSLSRKFVSTCRSSIANHRACLASSRLFTSS